jgi:hypothetical protein
MSRNQRSLINIRAVMPDVSAGGLQQMLAHMQLAIEAGTQLLAQLIQTFGRPEGCRVTLVCRRLRLRQERWDLDGIGLALPDAVSARHGVVQSMAELRPGQIDELDCVEDGWIDGGF